MSPATRSSAIGFLVSLLIVVATSVTARVYMGSMDAAQTNPNIEMAAR